MPVVKEDYYKQKLKSWSHVRESSYTANEEDFAIKDLPTNSRDMEVARLQAEHRNLGLREVARQRYKAVQGNSKDGQEEVKVNEQSIKAAKNELERLTILCAEEAERYGLDVERIPGILDESGFAGISNFGDTLNHEQFRKEVLAACDFSFTIELAGGDKGSYKILLNKEGNFEYQQQKIHAADVSHIIGNKSFKVISNFFDKERTTLQLNTKKVHVNSEQNKESALDSLPLTTQLREYSKYLNEILRNRQIGILIAYFNSPRYTDLLKERASKCTSITRSWLEESTQIPVDLVKELKKEAVEFRKEVTKIVDVVNKAEREQIFSAGLRYDQKRPSFNKVKHDFISDSQFEECFSRAVDSSDISAVKQLVKSLAKSVLAPSSVIVGVGSERSGKQSAGLNEDSKKEKITELLGRIDACKSDSYKIKSVIYDGLELDKISKDINGRQELINKIDGLLLPNFPSSDQVSTLNSVNDFLVSIVTGKPSRTKIKISSDTGQGKSFILKVIEKQVRHIKIGAIASSASSIHKAQELLNKEGIFDATREEISALQNRFIYGQDSFEKRRKNRRITVEENKAAEEYKVFLSQRGLYQIGESDNNKLFLSNGEINTKYRSSFNILNINFSNESILDELITDGSSLQGRIIFIDEAHYLDDIDKKKSKLQDLGAKIVEVGATLNIAKLGHDAGVREQKYYLVNDVKRISDNIEEAKQELFFLEIKDFSNAVGNFHTTIQKIFQTKIERVTKENVVQFLERYLLETIPELLISTGKYISTPVNEDYQKSLEAISKNMKEFHTELQELKSRMQDLKTKSFKDADEPGKTIKSNLADLLEKINHLFSGISAGLSLIENDPDNPLKSDKEVISSYYDQSALRQEIEDLESKRDKIVASEEYGRQINEYEAKQTRDSSVLTSLRERRETTINTINEKALYFPFNDAVIQDGSEVIDLFTNAHLSDVIQKSPKSQFIISDLGFEAESISIDKVIGEILLARKRCDTEKNSTNKDYGVVLKTRINGTEYLKSFRVNSDNLVESALYLGTQLKEATSYTQSRSNLGLNGGVRAILAVDPECDTLYDENPMLCAKKIAELCQQDLVVAIEYNKDKKYAVLSKEVSAIVWRDENRSSAPEILFSAQDTKGIAQLEKIATQTQNIVTANILDGNEVRTVVVEPSAVRAEVNFSELFHKNKIFNSQTSEAQAYINTIAAGRGELTVFGSKGRTRNNIGGDYGGTMGVLPPDGNQFIVFNSVEDFEDDNLIKSCLDLIKQDIGRNRDTRKEAQLNLVFSDSVLKFIIQKYDLEVGSGDRDIASLNAVKKAFTSILYQRSIRFDLEYDLNRTNRKISEFGRDVYGIRDNDGSLNSAINAYFSDTENNTELSEFLRGEKIITGFKKVLGKYIPVLGKVELFSGSNIEREDGFLDDTRSAAEAKKGEFEAIDTDHIKLSHEEYIPLNSFGDGTIKVYPGFIMPYKGDDKLEFKSGKTTRFELSELAKLNRDVRRNLAIQNIIDPKKTDNIITELAHISENISDYTIDIKSFKSQLLRDYMTALIKEGEIDREILAKIMESILTISENNRVGETSKAAFEEIELLIYDISQISQISKSIYSLKLEKAKEVIEGYIEGYKSRILLLRKNRLQAEEEAIKQQLKVAIAESQIRYGLKSEDVIALTRKSEKEISEAIEEADQSQTKRSTEIESLKRAKDANQTEINKIDKNLTTLKEKQNTLSGILDEINKKGENYSKLSALKKDLERLEDDKKALVVENNKVREKLVTILSTLKDHVEQTIEAETNLITSGFLRGEDSSLLQNKRITYTPRNNRDEYDYGIKALIDCIIIDLEGIDFDKESAENLGSNLVDRTTRSVLEAINSMVLTIQRYHKDKSMLEKSLENVRRSNAGLIETKRRLNHEIEFSDQNLKNLKEVQDTVFSLKNAREAQQKHKEDIDKLKRESKDNQDLVIRKLRKVSNKIKELEAGNPISQHINEVCNAINRFIDENLPDNKSIDAIFAQINAVNTLREGMISSEIIEELRQTKTDFEDHQNKYTGYINKIRQDLLEKITELEAKHKQSIIDISTTYSNTDTLNTNLAKQLKDAQGELETLKGNLADKATVEGDLDSVRKSLIEERGNVTKLTTELETLRTQIKSMEDEKSTSLTKIEKLEQSQRELTEQISKLNSTIFKKDTEIKEFKEQGNVLKDNAKKKLVGALDDIQRQTQIIANRYRDDDGNLTESYAFVDGEINEGNYEDFLGAAEGLMRGHISRLEEEYRIKEDELKDKDREIAELKSDLARYETNESKIHSSLDSIMRDQGIATAESPRKTLFQEVDNDTDRLTQTITPRQPSTPYTSGGRRARTPRTIYSDRKIDQGGSLDANAKISLIISRLNASHQEQIDDMVIKYDTDIILLNKKVSDATNESLQKQTQIDSLTLKAKGLQEEIDRLNGVVSVSNKGDNDKQVAISNLQTELDQTKLVLQQSQEAISRSDALVISLNKQIEEKQISYTNEIQRQRDELEQNSRKALEDQAKINAENETRAKQLAESQKQAALEDQKIKANTQAKQDRQKLKDVYDKRIKELEDLKDQVAEESNGQKRQINSLNKEVSQLKEEIDRLKEIANGSGIEANVAQEKITKLEKELRLKGIELDNLAKDKSKVDDNVVALEKRIIQEEEKYKAALSKQKTDLENSAISDKKAALYEQKMYSDRNHEIAIRALTDEKDRAIEDSQNNQVEIESLSKTIVNLRSQINTLRTKESASEEDDRSKEATILDLKRQLDATISDLTLLKEAKGRSDSRVDELNQQIRDKDTSHKAELEKAEQRRIDALSSQDRINLEKATNAQALAEYQKKSALDDQKTKLDAQAKRDLDDLRSRHQKKNEGLNETYQTALGELKAKNSRIDALEKEVTELNSEIQRLQNLANGSGQEATSALQEITRLKNELQSKSLELEDLNKAKSKSDEKVKELRNEIDQEIDKSSAALSKQKDELQATAREDKENALKALQNHHQLQLKSELESLEQAHKIVINSLEGQKKANETILKSKSDEIDELTILIDQHKKQSSTKLSEATQKIDNLNRDLQQLQRDKSQLEGDVRNLKAQIAAKQTEHEDQVEELISNAKTDIAKAIEKERNDARAESNNKQEEIDGLNRRIDSLKDQIKDLNDLSTDVSQNLSKDRLEIAELKRRLQDCQSDLALANESKAKSDKRVTELNDLIAKNEKDHQNHLQQEKLKWEREEEYNLKSLKQGYENDLRLLTADRDSAKEEIVSKQNEIDRLKAEIEDLKADLVKNGSNNTAKQSKIAELEGIVKQLTIEKSDAEKHIVNLVAKIDFKEQAYKQDLEEQKSLLEDKRLKDLASQKGISDSDKQFSLQELEARKNAEINFLKKQQREEIDALTSVKDKAIIDLDLKNEEIDEQKRINARLQDKINELRQENSGSDEASREKLAEIRRLSGLLTESTNKLRDYEEEKVQLNSRIKVLEDNIAREKEDHNEAMKSAANRHKLQLETSLSEQNLAANHNKKAALDKLREEKDNKIEELSGRLAAVNSELNSRRDDIAKLTREIYNMSSELESLNDDKSRLQRLLEKSNGDDKIQGIIAEKDREISQLKKTHEEEKARLEELHNIQIHNYEKQIETLNRLKNTGGITLEDYEKGIEDAKKSLNITITGLRQDLKSNAVIMTRYSDQIKSHEDSIRNLTRENKDLRDNPEGAQDLENQIAALKREKSKLKNQNEELVEENIELKKLLDKYQRAARTELVSPTQPYVDHRTPNRIEEGDDYSSVDHESSSVGGSSMGAHSFVEDRRAGGSVGGSLSSQWRRESDRSGDKQGTPSGIGIGKRNDSYLDTDKQTGSDGKLQGSTTRRGKRY